MNIFKVWEEVIFLERDRNSNWNIFFKKKKLKLFCCYIAAVAPIGIFKIENFINEIDWKNY